MKKKDQPEENRFAVLFGAFNQDEPLPPDTPELGKEEEGDRPSPAQSLSKSKDPQFQRTTVYLPKAMHRQLKAAAVEEEREMSDIIETLIQQWLEERKKN